MINLEYDDHGLGDRFKDIDNRLKIGINDGLRAIGKTFVPSKGTGPLADATPVGRDSQKGVTRTGDRLKTSTIFQVLDGLSGPNPRVEIRQGARSMKGVFYGHFVREGRGPVRPVRAKVLRFKIGGQWIFTQFVKATKPNPYHKRVLEKEQSAVDRIVERMGEKVTTYLAGTA